MFFYYTLLPSEILQKYFTYVNHIMYVEKATDKRKKLKHGNKYKNAKSDHSNTKRNRKVKLSTDIGCQ